MTRFAELIEGYHRFRNGGWNEQRERWEQLAEGQSPKVMVIACSDSRHYNGWVRDIYKFSAMQLSTEQRGLIHNNNERIPVTEVARTVEFFARLMEKL